MDGTTKDHTEKSVDAAADPINSVAALCRGSNAVAIDVVVVVVDHAKTSSRAPRCAQRTSASLHS